MENFITLPRTTPALLATQQASSRAASSARHTLTVALSGLRLVATAKHSSLFPLWTPANYCGQLPWGSGLDLRWGRNSRSSRLARVLGPLTKDAETFH